MSRKIAYHDTLAVSRFAVREACILCGNIISSPVEMAALPRLYYCRTYHSRALRQSRHAEAHMSREWMQCVLSPKHAGASRWHGPTSSISPNRTLPALPVYSDVLRRCLLGRGLFIPGEKASARLACPLSWKRFGKTMVRGHRHERSRSIWSSSTTMRVRALRVLQRLGATLCACVIQATPVRAIQLPFRR